MTTHTDPAAGYAVKAREFEASFDGGTVWEPCTGLDVATATSKAVAAALRERKVREVQSFNGVLYRRITR